MNITNNVGDNHFGGEANSVGSVSRSGRIRKKNSLLADYDSPDVIETARRKSEKAHKNKKDGSIRSHVKSRMKGRRHSYGLSLSQSDYHDGSSSNDFYNHSDSYGGLNITHEAYDDVPDIAAEEIIDEGLLEEEDGATELSDSLDIGKAHLKSQAQSTYMMEKSFEKHRKLPVNIMGVKKKATRKDKGSPRVTAYMLWAREQRANFAKKYPNMDFTSLSKKLSDLWSTVPQNHKKMWKTKAAKIMRKNAHGAENIKNSGGPSLILARKSVPLIPQRKGMKNTTPQQVYIPKRPPGRPKKAFPVMSTASSELRLVSLAAKPGTSSKSYIYNNNTTSTLQLGGRAASYKVATTTSTVTSIAPGPSLTSVVDEERTQPAYQFQVTGTDPLDVAAHLSLLGESMTKMGQQLQNAQCQPNESLSVLLDSLLCSVGPLLCLTQKVPELDCIPESQLKRILNNLDYAMPGL